MADAVREEMLCSSTNQDQVTIQTLFDKGRLRTRKQAVFGVLPPIALTRQPMSAADRSKKLYLKRKEHDPDAHKEYLATKKISSKAKRDNFKASATDEEKALQRKKTRERVAKCRQNKKELGLIESKPDRPRTRMDQEKLDRKREMDRDRKRRERAAWPRQKKKAESLKATKRRNVRKAPACEAVVEEAGVSVTRSDVSRRVALHRVRRALPKNPTARAETLNDLISSTKTSMKDDLNRQVKAILGGCGRRVAREMGKHLLSLDKKSRRVASKLLMVSRQQLHRLKSIKSFHTTQLRKGDGTDVTLIRAFLQDNSVVSSEKKHVTKHGPRMTLRDEVGRLYKKFCEEHPASKVGRALFYKSRARHMKLAQSAQLNQCLCETCTNVTLMLKSVKLAHPRLPSSKKAVLDGILCQRNGTFHRKDCLQMSCSSCGPELLLSKFLEKTPKINSVHCQQWVNLRKGGKTRKVLEAKDWVLTELVAALKKDLAVYPMHLFTATWQYQQFNLMRNNVERGSLVMVYDFAENYRSSYQDEVQAAHWNYVQVTLHPVVCYYRCACDTIITHSVVVVSDDTTHDCFAVDHMVRAVHRHLQGQGILFKKSIEWSDGCTAQYKSKGPFFLLQRRTHDGLVVDRHFFGSRHGKNPSDGESAIVKSAVTRAVKCRRVVVKNADDLFAFARQNLEKVGAGDECCHFQRSFLFVKSGEINRKALPPLNRIEGTRSLHSIIATNQHDLQFRNLSCACRGCLQGDVCVQPYIAPWETHRFHVAEDYVRDPEPALPGGLLVEPSSVDLTSAAPNPNSSICSGGGMDLLSTSTLEYLECLNEDNSDANPNALPTDNLAVHNGLIEPSFDKDTNDANPNALPTENLAVHNEGLIEPSLDKDTSDANPNALPTENLAVHNEGLIEPSLDKDNSDANPNALPTENLAVHNEGLIEPSFDKVEHVGQISTGAWVMASFSGKKVKMFMGLVLAVEDDEANVKFCRQNGKIFTWPMVDDIGWMPFYALTQVDAPTLDSRERMLFPEHVTRRLV